MYAQESSHAVAADVALPGRAADFTCTLLRHLDADAILGRNLGSAITTMLSSELVRSVLDSAPDAMIIIDSAGSILFANRQVRPLFGYPARDRRREGRGAAARAVSRAPHRSSRRLRAQRARASHGMGLELFGMRKDGTEFPVEISLSPIGAGGESHGRRGHPRRHRAQAGRAGAAKKRAAKPSAPISPRAAFSPPRATICASRCRRSAC